MTKQLDAGEHAVLARFTARTIGRRRLLALLPVLGLSLAASGGIASPSYGVRPYYGDPYYDARRSYYGADPYYSSQRTVVVQPRRVIVRQPTYRYHRADRVYRSDHRHRAHREDRGSRAYRAVRPASRPSVRGHDRQRSETRGSDHHSDRRQVRERERTRDRTRTLGDEERPGDEERRHGRGRR